MNYLQCEVQLLIVITWITLQSEGVYYLILLSHFALGYLPLESVLGGGGYRLVIAIRLVKGYKVKVT